MPERALHVGIDARELCGHPTGVGRYLDGLLASWANDADLPHRFTLVAPDSLPAYAGRPGDRIRVLVDPARTAGTWWEQTRLPRAARRLDVDVWFSPGYSAPLRLRCPSVVAIHDVAFFAHPEWFSWREGARRRLLTRAAARRAHTIVTISEFSRQEIARWTGVPAARIRLAPPGPPTLPPRAAADGPREPIALFVGSLFNRRRIPELIQGFAGAAQRVSGARLILVGDNRTRPLIDPESIARAHGIADRVAWRAYVADDELYRLYRTACVFVFLSDYEGFAMTPLEALAYEVPSVLLDTAVAREVYGAAARYITRPEELEAALIELLTDENRRAALVRTGRSLLTKYSWIESARVVRHALEEAAAS